MLVVVSAVWHKGCIIRMIHIHFLEIKPVSLVLWKLYFLFFHPFIHFLYFKDTICKNWPHVEFLLQTSWRQHITRKLGCQSLSWETRKCIFPPIGRVPSSQASGVWHTLSVSRCLNHSHTKIRWIGDCIMGSYQWV